MATANLVEQIKQQTVSLTFAEKQDLADFLAEQLRRENDSHKSANGGASTKKHEKHLAWLKQHREEYAGKYVALDGDVLVGQGATMREARASAALNDCKNPFVVFVYSINDTPFAGW